MIQRVLRQLHPRLPQTSVPRSPRKEFIFMRSLGSILVLAFLSMGAAFMLWVLWKITLDMKKIRRNRFRG